MVKQILVLLSSLVGLVIGGCQSSHPKELVKVTSAEYLALPDYYLESCPYPLPPNKETFVKKSYVEREEELVKIYLEGSEMNHKCNIRLREAKAYQDKMVKLYRSKNEHSNGGVIKSNSQ